MSLSPVSRRATAILAPILVIIWLGPVGCGVVARTGKGIRESLSPGGGNRGGGSEVRPNVDPVPLGEVSYVDARSRFVLVRTGRTVTLKTGAALEARRGEEQVADLSYSPENRRGFLVADILRGNPAVGDLVMLHGSEIAEREEARRQAIARRADAVQAERDANRERGRKRGGARK